MMGFKYYLKKYGILTLDKPDKIFVWVNPNPHSAGFYFLLFSSLLVYFCSIFIKGLKQANKVVIIFL